MCTGFALAIEVLIVGALVAGDLHMNKSESGMKSAGRCCRWGVFVGAEALR